VVTQLCDFLLFEANLLMKSASARVRGGFKYVRSASAIRVFTQDLHGTRNIVDFIPT
jgi:hypothetical protein